MITEIRIYKLKEHSAPRFHSVFMEQSLPMMKRWNVDIVDYGFSVIDKESFYLIRRYENISHRQESQTALYGSDEWINGPEQAIMDCIHTYTTAVVDSDTLTVVNTASDKQEQSSI